MFYVIIALSMYALGFFAGVIYGALKRVTDVASIKPIQKQKKHVLTDEERREQAMYDNIEAFGTKTPQKEVI